MIDNPYNEIETKCVHSGIGEYEFSPVIPPIYQTSTFQLKSAKRGLDLFGGSEKGYIYTRMNNPTIEAMEKCVADLEGGYMSLGCASGMAAIHTVFASLLNSGDHVVCSAALYGPTMTLLETVMGRFGISATFVDTSEISAVEAAMQENTKLVFVETPGNPTLAISDIYSISQIAHSQKAYVVVDNTFMSPILQKPFSFGADIIVHSMTKFLNGHADVIGGIIVVKDKEMYITLRKILNQLGGVIDPFNAFLVHRGIKTLALRMKRHCENAFAVTKFLENHPLIKTVIYPGLPTHPQYQLGQRQQEGSGGLISIRIDGDYAVAQRILDSVRLCALAVSLGGVETLIQHPATMTHFSMGEDARNAAGITDNLIRLSVGIENVTDIIADLEEAFRKAVD